MKSVLLLQVRYYLLIFLALISGCTVCNKGTVHHIILGFGVVSVSAGTNNLAKVVNSNVVGIHLSSGPGLKAGVGYASQATVYVNSTNLLIEVDRFPGRPLTVTVP